jgi:hypothetical protein
MPYQGCDNVVSCSNGSTLLHPGLYAAVSLSSCSPSPVKGQAIRTCDDVVVVEEVWNQIAGGNCSSVCSPRLGSGQGYGKPGNCKSMLLELRTNSLLTALKLRTALKSTSSVGLLERCLGGAPELPTVQAVGPAGSNPGRHRLLMMLRLCKELRILLLQRNLRFGVTLNTK